MIPKITEYLAVGLLRVDVKFVTASVTFRGPEVGELNSFRNPLRVTMMADRDTVGLEDGRTHFSKASAYASRISLPKAAHEGSGKCCSRTLHHSTNTKALEVAMPCFEASCCSVWTNSCSVDEGASPVIIDTRHFWAASLDSRS